MSEQNEQPRNDRAATGGMSGTLREHLHEHEDICRQLEALPETAPADYRAEIDRLTAAWNALDPVPPEYAEILDKKYQVARQTAEDGARQAEEKVKQRERQIEQARKLHAELDNLLAAGELVVPAEVMALGKKWAETTAELSPEESGAAEFNARFEPLRVQMEAEAAAEQAAAEAAAKLTEELIQLTAGEDMALLKERKTAIEAEYAALGKVGKAAADKYNDAHRKAASKLAQHYETLDLARWESYTLKQDICNELDRLNELPEAELPKAARELRVLRDKWKELGAVPKSKADEINPRYLETTRKLQHRIDEYYANVRQQQKQAAAAKQLLCEKAAALADSTEWNATAAAFKELQVEWKNTPGAGAQEKTLFAAFRASADKFFNARSAWFEERNEKFEKIAAVKRQLLAEAEALNDPATDRTRALDRAKQLRGEFMAAGRAGRAEAELYEKFNAALDQFFNSRREVFAGREEEARKLIAELDALGGAITDTAAAETRYKAIRRELKELGCRKTFQSEIKAGEKFEKALAAARARALGDKLSLMKSVALPLAAVWEEVKAAPGTALAEGRLDIEGLDRFPKLKAAAQLISQAAGGDDAAREKLLKQFDHNAAEHQRITVELEKLVGIEPEAEAGAASGEQSLADELLAAITGNFGGPELKAEARSRTVDPKQLLSEYINAGLLEQPALERSFARFDAAYGKVR